MDATLDPAVLLSSQRDAQQRLKDQAVDPALMSMRHHSATNVRFIKALAQLARYIMDQSEKAEEGSCTVCAAVDACRAKLRVGYDALDLHHPLLIQAAVEERDSEQLLQRLFEAVEDSRARVEAAIIAMRELGDLHLLHEDEWRGHALARDQARQDQVMLSTLLIEAMRAKQHRLERMLSRAEDVASFDLPEPSSMGRTTASSVEIEANHSNASPLMVACDELSRCVDEMSDACGGEALAQAAAIAARISEGQSARQEKLRSELHSVASALGAARRALADPLSLHERRSQAEALLATLESLQAEVAAARKDERKARRKLEDLEDEAAPNDPDVRKAQLRHVEIRGCVAALTRRRDGVMSELSSLSASPLLANRQVVADDDAIRLDFPELPLRAQRIVQPFQSYEQLDEAARARYGVEMLLRRAGLLAPERNYESYDGLTVIVESKPNVKRASLRGAAPGAAQKILKEFGVGDFRRIKRAVATASRLRHPGIVPAECAFLERGNVVVVQSPFYSGGNMRHWCQGKPAEAKLAAAHRVAEAVRFLHVHGVLHRDLKPENVVFDGEGQEATPALCDFDLSVNAHETLASTLMRGTFLYLAPDPVPSEASDVFALGVTLLDVLFCHGDEEQLRQWVLGSGSTRQAADLADLERVRADLQRRTEDAELAALVASMLALTPGERPAASAVTEALADLLNVRTCYMCHCPEPRERGLECDAAEKHFCCDECFSEHVARADSLLCHEVGGLRIKCCASINGCAATFTLQSAATHAASLAFEAMQRNVEDLRHVALQGEFEAWKRHFESEFAAKTELERRVLATRRHIEEMMDLRCPKCHQVFGEFSGCAALTCEYRGCNAHFCAFCLADCGTDAHPHVRTCRLNPRKNEYYVSAAEWARVIDGQRREKLQVYWAALDAETRDALAADASVCQILRDLQLDGLLGASAFAEQMAQLRGMGLTDEREMRRALREADGDVAAALDLLWGVPEIR